LVSQNRQSDKDRIRNELDYQVNLKAELGVSVLLQKTDALADALQAIEARLTPPKGGSLPVASRPRK
jgi:uncharacterized membrane protein